MTPRILAVDAGTTSVKVCLFSADLTLKKKSVQEYRLKTAGNRAEADGNTYLEAVRRGIRAVCPDGDSVSAVSLTTQGETLTVCDPAGRPLRPFLVWLDQRAESEAALLKKQFPDDVFYRETGLPGLTGAVPLAKALWLKRHEPQLFVPGCRLLLVEDYLLHFLTGRFVTEKTLQTSTGWFSLRKDAWWPEALEAAGLAADALPDLLESGAPAGVLTPAAASALGLCPGIPVFTGAMDQVAASHALDFLLPGAAMETTGTALVAGTVLHSLAPMDQPGLPRTTVYRHAVPGKYMLLPVGNTGGMSLTWFRDSFCPGAEYNSLCLSALSTPPGAEGLLFLPFLDGSVDPDFCPEARGVFFGASLSTGRDHFVRAVMEGVAHLLAELLDVMSRWDVPAGPVISFGGGSGSAGWEQIKADICGREFITLQHGEAAALGAALLAARGADIPLPDTAPLLTGSVRYTPEAAHAEVYERAHRKFRALYQAVRPLF